MELGIGANFHGLRHHPSLPVVPTLQPLETPELLSLILLEDNLCRLAVRIPSCRPRDPGFDSRRCQIFLVAVGLERGPLNPLRINEELLERKVAALV
jgi:hypothetical protein